MSMMCMKPELELTWDDIYEYVIIAKINDTNYDISIDENIKAVLYLHLCKYITTIDCDLCRINNKNIYKIENIDGGGGIDFTYYSSISDIFYDTLNCTKPTIMKILKGYLEHTFNVKVNSIW